MGEGKGGAIHEILGHNGFIFTNNHTQRVNYVSFFSPTVDYLLSVKRLESY